MEEHICLNCSFWISQDFDVNSGYCKAILYGDQNWLKDAEKRYSDSCANFEPKNEKRNKSESDFPFI